MSSSRTGTILLSLCDQKILFSSEITGCRDLTGSVVDGTLDGGGRPLDLIPLTLGQPPADF